jgi:Flagellar biosynthesis pathway, component FliR
MNPLDDAIVNSILVHLLVSVRFLGVIFTAGVFVLPSLPVPVRFWLSVALALVLTPVLDIGMPTLFTTAPLFLVTMLVRELIIGVAIGFFSSLPLHALQMSGYLEGTLMGFNMMNIFVPAFRNAIVRYRSG